MVSGVVGGVDTHADVHVAAALDLNGVVLGIESFPTDTAGYRLSVVRDPDGDDSGHLRMISGSDVLQYAVSFTGLHAPSYVEVPEPSRIALSLVRSALTRRLNAHLINAVNGR